MGYHIEFSDVVKYKGDAIVNSLGVNGNVYGRLCQNIVEADKSNTIKNIIDNKLNNTIGDIFITPAGDLKCDNIIHVVTPFRHMDDANVSLLKNTYKAIIDMAIQQEYKTLALPFIGTGANGYEDDEAYEAIEYACDELIALEEKSGKDILDITVIGFLKSGKAMEEYMYNMRRRMNLERKYYDLDFCDCVFESCSMPGSAPISKVYSDFEYCAEAMSEINCEEFIDCKKSYKNPYDFIKHYLKVTGKNEKEFLKAGINANQKYKLSIRTSLTKINIYRLAYLCKMNMSELVQFMIICETSFNPGSKLDLFMIKYFRGEFPWIQTIYNFAYWVKQNTKVDIFNFTKND